MRGLFKNNKYKLLVYLSEKDKPKKTDPRWLNLFLSQKYSKLKWESIYVGSDHLK